jgi:hypothetical protein
MIRPSTILWIALAGGVGVGTYQLKHRMLAFEDELARINRQVTAEQQAIHVLRAEWAYITQPQRLQPLANRHLDMNTMTPAQIGRVADLPARPPAPPAPPEPQIQAASPPPAPAPQDPRNQAANPPPPTAPDPQIRAAGAPVQPAAAPQPTPQPVFTGPNSVPGVTPALVVTTVPSTPPRRPAARPAPAQAPRNDAIGALLSQMSTAATQHADSVRTGRGLTPSR